MRYITIPGFGEEPWMFDRITDELEGELLSLNHYDVLGQERRGRYSLLMAAEEFVQKYDIGADDVIIGHSMGGWIGLGIKQLTGCRLVQIGSWTDPRKVLLPSRNKRLVFWVVRRRLYFTALSQRLVIGLFYRKRPSKAAFHRLFSHLRASHPEYIVNQLKLVLTPADRDPEVTPDLRIHSLKDHIVRPPEEPYALVPGDHFALWTYPRQVKEALGDWLRKLDKAPA